jgi:hypothetical protein
MYSKMNKITMQSFTRKLKAFVQLCPWISELNPQDLCNSSGRIQQAIEVTPGLKKTKDMIYLRSVKEIEQEEDTQHNEQQDEEDLPF